MDSKKLFKFLAAGALALTTLAGCSGSGNNNGGDTNNVKIGLHFELTGGVAEYGNAELRGAELAIKLANASGTNKYTGSVVIPESVTYSGTVYSVTSIGYSAFSGCSGLTSVVWNAKNCNISSYSSSPFYDIRSQITSFTIGNEVEHIPNYLCYEMNNLTSITIPNSVTSIGDYAFYNCSNLNMVNYLGTVEEWIEIDFESGFSNPTYYAKDLYINGELLTDVKISSADSIKKYAFYNCESIKSVEMSNSVTSIGNGAFSG